MRESLIEERVCKYAESQGFIVRKIRYVNRHGAPDRMFIGHGKVIFIEFKATGAKAKLHQERERARYASHGVKVHIIDDIDDGCLLFDA